MCTILCHRVSCISFHEHAFLTLCKSFWTLAPFFSSIDPSRGGGQVLPPGKGFSLPDLLCSQARALNVPAACHVRHSGHSI